MDIVFHLSSSQSVDGAEALANVSNLLGDETADVDSVVLIANGGGVQHLRSDSDVADRVRVLMEHGVEFKACRNAMNAQNISSGDLVDGIGTVPSGIGGVANLESDGYSYIKIP
ncbi:DsrE family protein [Haloarcula litorea]|uniref:DsrE family protein n=1 Tax=Haloarcula litorea TaxID=3032579 RepID=UPI0023E758D8|nr:DsrE family protein [Halomicroarcula sp. GDY20]